MSKKTTKRALAMSFVSVFLCVCMLVGTTFAWFTDSVTSSENIIKSGTLDVEMYWAKGNEAVPTTDAGWTNAASGAIFNYDKWEPGYVDVKHIQIKNNGTLALKYQLSIIPNGVVSELANVIDVYFIDPAQQVADRTALTDTYKIGTLAQVLAGMPASTSAEMLSGDVDTVTIALKMQETADNKYQNKSIGSAFAVQLLATQLTYEKDSFDDLYDQNAGYAVEVNSADALADALRGGGLVKLTGDIAVSESMTIPAGVTVNLDLNGQTITAAMEKGDGALLANKGTLNIVGGTMENTTENGDSVINNEGTLTLDDVTIVGAPIGTTGYPAYAVYSTGKLTIEEGTSITSDRGALNVSGETVINGGDFEVTAAASSRSLTCHTVYASGSTLTINGGSFENNYSGVSGASVICPAGSTIEINGGTFRDAVDDTSNFNNTANIQNYMGYGKPIIVRGGSFDDNTFQSHVAFGYEATDNGDGTWIVGPKNWIVGPKKISASNATAAITAGGALELTEDVTYGSPINNDTTIDLNGNTFEATGSYTLGNNADLTMTGGDYEVNSTFGHVDVRPDTAEGSVVTFEDVDFTSNYKNKTFGTCTDRLVSVVEVTPATADGHVVAVFRNCTFNNAKVYFEGMSGKTGSFEAIFENCTFTALTSSAPIEVMNYIEGTITVKNCTFNLTCTSSSASAIGVSPSSSTTVTINAENNTINATAATAHTYDPAAGETEVDNIKVFGTPNNIQFISAYANTTVNETNTTKTGIAG